MHMLWVIHVNWNNPYTCNPLFSLSRLIVVILSQSCHTHPHNVSWHWLNQCLRPHVTVWKNNGYEITNRKNTWQLWRASRPADPTAHPHVLPVDLSSPSSHSTILSATAVTSTPTTPMQWTGKPNRASQPTGGTAGNGMERGRERGRGHYKTGRSVWHLQRQRAASNDDELQRG